MRIAGLLLIVAVAGCSQPDNGTVTLYRNSMLQTSMRVQWATFDASDGFSYNWNNCSMAARLLNANMDASARAEGVERNPAIGFWCEPGGYAEDGVVPGSFVGAFPTDV